MGWPNCSINSTTSHALSESPRFIELPSNNPNESPSGITLLSPISLARMICSDSLLVAQVRRSALRVKVVCEPSTASNACTTSFMVSTRLKSLHNRSTSAKNPFEGATLTSFIIPKVPSIRLSKSSPFAQSDATAFKNAEKNISSNLLTSAARTLSHTLTAALESFAFSHIRNMTVYIAASPLVPFVIYVTLHCKQIKNSKEKQKISKIPQKQHRRRRVQ